MGILKIYKSYSFIDKDPIIDKLRTIKEKGGHTNKFIHAESGVAVGTLAKWWGGNTKRPQFATTMAVARAMGYSLVLAPSKGTIRSTDLIHLPMKSSKN